MPYKTETIQPGTEAAHGQHGAVAPERMVCGLILTLDGERVVKAVPVMGYLHRGMEKIAENKTYTLQFIPYTDRLDYLAPLSNNVAFALTSGEARRGDGAPTLPGDPICVRDVAHLGAPSLARHARRGSGAISVFMCTPSASAKCCTTSPKRSQARD